MSHSKVSQPHTTMMQGDRHVELERADLDRSPRFSRFRRSGLSNSRYVWARRTQESEKLSLIDGLPCPSAKRSQLEKHKVKFAIHLTTHSWHGLGKSWPTLDSERVSDRDSSPRLKDLTQFRLTRRSPASPSDDLRKTLVDYFQSQAATFDFWAQLQAKLLPLAFEDPTLGWQDQAPSDYPVTIIELPPAHRS